VISKYQTLLDLIRPHSINNPTTDIDLQKGTGLPIVELRKTLDKMAYQIPGLIGRCEVVKSGESIMQIWPSAAFSKANVHELAGSKTQYTPQITPAAARTLTTKEPVMEKDKVIRNTDIVQYVKDHPGLNKLQVSKAMSGDSKTEQNTTSIKINQCIKNRYLAIDKKGLMILGDNEQWLAQHGFLEAKPVPVTEAIKPEAPQEQAAALNPPESGLQKIHSEYAEVSFAQPSQIQAVVLAPPQQGAVMNTPLAEAEPFTSAAETEIPVEPAAQMTVAYYSDGSLHLIGLQDKPIILKRDQAEILTGFMNKCRLIG
jgi:hypothetical protein